MVSIQEAESAMTLAASRGNSEPISDSVARLFPLFMRLQSQRSLPQGKEYVYGPLDRQKLDVYSPSTSGKSPVLLFVHGGGLSRGDKRINESVHANLGNFFSERGFVTVVMNYRLYGTHDARFPSGGEDVSLALAWLSQLPQADLDNVFLCGNSAGGVHVSTYLYGDAIPQAKFKEVKIRAAVLMSVPMSFEDPANENRREVLDGYFGSREDTKKYSPISLRRASTDRTPTLVSWGEHDPPSEILDSINEYLALWNGQAPQGIDRPEEMCMRAQTHIGLPLSLGLGGSADEWGCDLVQWMKSKVSTEH